MRNAISSGLLCLTAVALIGTQNVGSPQAKAETQASPTQISESALKENDPNGDASDPRHEDEVESICGWDGIEPSVTLVGTVTDIAYSSGLTGDDDWSI